MGFLAAVAGGAIAFAREQVKWYQNRDSRWETILETQQDTLEKMETNNKERDEKILATLDTRLPERKEAPGG